MVRVRVRGWVSPWKSSQRQTSNDVCACVHVCESMPDYWSSSCFQLAPFEEVTEESSTFQVRARGSSRTEKSTEGSCAALRHRISHHTISLSLSVLTVLASKPDRLGPKCKYKPDFFLIIIIQKQLFLQRQIWTDILHISWVVLCVIPPRCDFWGSLVYISLTFLCRLPHLTVAGR